MGEGLLDLEPLAAPETELVSVREPPGGGWAQVAKRWCVYL